MRFDLQHAIEILSRTPPALDTMLRGLPKEWTKSNEGDNTWSPYDVVGHLAHGEEADWIARARIILESGDLRTFEPFDRFAQFKRFEGKSIEELLDIFASLRERNLLTLRGLGLRDLDLDFKGRHPELGGVTLGQLLSTWVVHDLGHIGQIARVMSKQYFAEVGPWKKYLRVLC